MTNYIQQILTGQFEASLAMMNQCLQACRPEHWEGKIANGTFRQVAYHTLFFVDFYSSASEESFELRDVHHRGGDERIDGPPCAGLPKEETLPYLAICRQKVIEAIVLETAETLTGPSGFSRRTFSRGELHIYNLRHVQHHTGQLSAYLRRTDESLSDFRALPWIGSGWR